MSTLADPHYLAETVANIDRKIQAKERERIRRTADNQGKIIARRLRSI